MPESTKELSGEELDRAVAERVMGNTLPEVWSDPTVGPSHGDPGGYRIGVRPYSSSIEAAMQVLDKLRHSGEWCCIEIKSDYHYVWWVALTPAERHSTDPHKPTIAVSGEVLPTVICLVALAAIRSKE
jgi:hypothetical protein